MPPQAQAAAGTSHQSLACLRAADVAGQSLTRRWTTKARHKATKTSDASRMISLRFLFPDDAAPLASGMAKFYTAR